MNFFSVFRKVLGGTGDRQEGRAGPEVDYRALLEGSLDMICLAELKRDGSRRFVYASPSTRDVIGWSSAELLQLTPRDIYTPESIALIAQEIGKLQRDGTSHVMLEAIRKDGQHIWVENKVKVLERGEGGMSVVICTRDITERKLLEDALAQQALVDGLTGIHNRRAFDAALEREWKRGAREGTMLSVALLDVDHFKRFNDSYGHLAGDDCLRAIAAAVKDAVKRPGDMVARFGGEELAILLPATELEPAKMVANRCCQAVAALLIPHCGNAEGMGLVTLSGGVSAGRAAIPGEARMPEGLLLAADAALYGAKQKGRNRVESLVPGEGE